MTYIYVMRHTQGHYLHDVKRHTRQRGR